MDRLIYVFYLTRKKLYYPSFIYKIEKLLRQVEEIKLENTYAINKRRSFKNYFIAGKVAGKCISSKVMNNCSKECTTNIASSLISSVCIFFSGRL